MGRRQGPGTRARIRAAGAALVGATLAAVLAGCGIAGAGGGIAAKDELVIGVNGDQPGLGLEEDGTFGGFDVEVAKEIARRLGFGSDRIRFHRVTSGVREDKIANGDVDIIIASYSVTQKRKTRVAFGGPYYVAHQDVLVRASDTDVDDVRDLRGKRLCRVKGSVSFPRVREERGVVVSPVDAPGYGDCVTALRAGRLDAVSTDDLILAGLASTPGEKLRIVNAPISDEPYGVGIARQDVEGCEAVNKAITKMYQDGTMKKLLSTWFGPVGLDVTTTVPQFEGCD